MAPYIFSENKNALPLCKEQFLENEQTTKLMLSLKLNGKPELVPFGLNLFSVVR